MCKSIVNHLLLYDKSHTNEIFVSTIDASILDITELQPQTKKRKNANEIKLKIQSAGCRKIREVYIDKTDKLEVLVLTCAEQLKCDPNTIKLK